MRGFRFKRRKRPFWAAPVVRRRFWKALPSEIYSMLLGSQRKLTGFRRKRPFWAAPVVRRRFWKALPTEIYSMLLGSQRKLIGFLWATVQDSNLRQSAALQPLPRD